MSDGIQSIGSPLLTGISVAAMSFVGLRHVEAFHGGSALFRTPPAKRFLPIIWCAMGLTLLRSFTEKKEGKPLDMRTRCAEIIVGQGELIGALFLAKLHLPIWFSAGLMTGAAEMFRQRILFDRSAEETHITTAVATFSALGLASLLSRPARKAASGFLSGLVLDQAEIGRRFPASHHALFYPIASDQPRLITTMIDRINEAMIRKKYALMEESTPLFEGTKFMVTQWLTQERPYAMFPALHYQASGEIVKIQLGLHRQIAKDTTQFWVTPYVSTATAGTQKEILDFLAHTLHFPRQSHVTYHIPSVENLQRFPSQLSPKGGWWEAIVETQRRQLTHVNWGATQPVQAFHHVGHGVMMAMKVDVPTAKAAWNGPATVSFFVDPALQTDLTNLTLSSAITAFRSAIPRLIGS